MLEENGSVVFVVDDGKEAKAELMALIRRGAEVNSATSTTLDQIGVTGEIESSGNYIALRKVGVQTTDLAKRDELRKRAQVAEYCIGSVHAVTEDGHIVVASATGSQIAPTLTGRTSLHTRGKLAEAGKGHRRGVQEDIRLLFPQGERAHGKIYGVKAA